MADAEGPTQEEPEPPQGRAEGGSRVQRKDARTGDLARLAEDVAAELDVERVGVWVTEEGGRVLRRLHLYDRRSDRHGSGGLLTRDRFPDYLGALRESRELAVEQVEEEPCVQELLDPYARPLGIEAWLDVLFPPDERPATGLFRLESVGAERRWSEAERRLARRAAASAAALLDGGRDPGPGRGKLVLHYQPVVDLPGRRVAGYESLVRWSRADGGILEAADLLPGARSRGRLPSIDRWVLRRAASRAAGWDARPPRAWIAVNVDPVTLAAGEYCPLLERLVGESPELADRLILEVPASGAPSPPRAALSRVRAAGCRLAIDVDPDRPDPFRIPEGVAADVLKVPVRWVGTAAGPGKKELCAAAGELGAEVGVTQVETTAQLAEAAEMDARYVQGRHLGAPEPAPDDGEE